MGFPKHLAFSTVLLVAALAIACQQGADVAEPEPGVGTIASAEIMDGDGQSLGIVTLTQGPQGVLVSADLRGLPSGGHAFHIHSVGSCSPDFSAAGGHFAPNDETHGFLYSTDMHAGDLPNIYVSDDGVARAHVFTDDITLASGDNRSIFDSDGSSIIIHEEPDDYGEDSSVAGGRIACGVIERS